MAADFNIKRGDTRPVLTDKLAYSDGSNVNLTGATVKFVMRAITATGPAVNATATIVTPSTGNVSYTFTANDSNVAGSYQAVWMVTFPDLSTMTFPTDGYMEVLVEEDITTAGGSRIVSLYEVKDHLKIPTGDRSHDARLQRMIDAVAPVVENITGPILQHIYQNEAYDGGHWMISLRHRPVITVSNVVEYRGPIAYTLTQVPTPDVGTIYSYMFEPPGRIVRRTVGGGVVTFPPGADAVSVTYTAGYLKVPTNVTEGTLELIRVNYQQTEQGGRPTWGSSPGEIDSMPGQNMMGFFVPGRVRELLSPNKRHVSIA